MKKSETTPVEAASINPIRDQKNSPHRILVVDKDDYARQLNVEVLASLGYDVEVANNVAAGWAALQRNNYDLIIADNKTPDMTGIDMIGKLRAARISIPIIMITGNLPALKHNIEPWQKSDNMLQNPFSDDDLLEVVIKNLHMDDVHKRTPLRKNLPLTKTADRTDAEAKGSL
jgi:DNA-binding response OmpR family regulator